MTDRSFTHFNCSNVHLPVRPDHTILNPCSRHEAAHSGFAWMNSTVISNWDLTIKTKYSGDMFLSSLTLAASVTALSASTSARARGSFSLKNLPEARSWVRTFSRLGCSAAKSRYLSQI